MLRRQQIIAVVIKQYGTGLYRSCVSMGKDNVVYMGTHQDERSANERISQFWKAYDEGEIKQPEDLARWMGRPAPAAEEIFAPLAA